MKNFLKHSLVILILVLSSTHVLATNIKKHDPKKFDSYYRYIYQCPKEEDLASFLLNNAKKYEERIRRDFKEELELLPIDDFKTEKSVEEIFYTLDIQKRLVDSSTYSLIPKKNQLDILLVNLGDIYHVLVHLMMFEENHDQAMLYNLKSMNYHLLNMHGSISSYNGIYHAFDHFDDLLDKKGEKHFLDLLEKNNGVPVLSQKQLSRFDHEYNMLICNNVLRREPAKLLTKRSYKFLNKVLKRPLD